MAGNVEVETDAAGNQKPSKARSSERIDGIVGLTMAIGRVIVHAEAEEVEPAVLYGRAR
jgi:phage terminase large subunit-like protein